MSNSRKSFPWLTACLLLASCFGAGGSSDDGTGTGVTLFVDASNNTGQADGSEAHPYVGIQDAVDVCLGGEVLRIAAGLYEEDLSIDVDLRLIGAGAGSTEIRSDGATPVFTLGGDVESFHVEGFTLRNGFSNRAGVASGTGVAMSFRECILRDNATGDSSDGTELVSAAVLRVNESGSLDIERCIFLDNASHGVAVVEPSASAIRNCVLAMGDGYGIYVRGLGETQDPDVTIRNVTVSGFSLDAVYLARFGDCVVQNCIQSSNRNALFESRFAGDPLMIFNDLQDGYGDADTDRSYNDPADINALDPPGQNEGNIAADPAFVDAAAGDYRLAAGSPCIDTGDPSVLDADGSRSDMGAFGGPLGDFDAAFATSLARDFTPTSQSERDLAALLDADPHCAIEGRSHWTDLDRDGRPDRLSIEGDRLQWWVDRRGRGPRPAPLPPALGPLRRATTYDVDDDGALDLIVEDTKGRHDLHRSSREDAAGFALHARPGDRVEVELGAQRFERRVEGDRGDRADGALLFSLGSAAEARVRVWREGRIVLDAVARAGDRLGTPTEDRGEVER